MRNSSEKMKWRLTIAVWAFACVSFSSSVPVSIQDDFAAMYPIEYYPAYFQNDFAKIDIDFLKWFRNAANSVKHFYNYVNTLIFGRNEGEPTIGQYPTFKESINAEAPHVANTQPQDLGINLPHIRAFEVYKGADGNVVLRNLNHQDQNTQVLQNVPLKPNLDLDRPMNFLLNDDALFRQMNSKIAKNPFHWNEKLEKDELFSGAFQNYAVNPELLWHSGIFPFQPIGAFNVAGQSAQVLNQSTEAPNVSDKPKTTEVNNQQIEQNQSSTSDQPVPEITTIHEESLSYENSNSSNDQATSNEYGSQYEFSLEVERIKQNKSDPESDTTTGDDDGKAKSDITESSDTSLSAENDGMKSESEDDHLADLTELDTMQVSSDDDDGDESDQNDQKLEPEITETPKEKSEVNSENSASVVETSTSLENSEKKFAPVAKSRESDESDIAKRVLAMVNSQ